MEKCSRLSTYAKVKGELKRERYLDWLRGEELRGVLLRGGANDLEIDRGRQERNPERRGFARCARMVSKMRFILLRSNAYQEQRRVVQEKLSLREPLLGWSSLCEKQETAESDRTVCCCD